MRCTLRSAETAFRIRAACAERGQDFIEVQPATVSGHSQSGALDPAQPLSSLIENLDRGRLAASPGGPAHWIPLVPVDTLATLT